MTTDQQDKPPLQCRRCGREVRLGEDLLILEPAVLGPRGVVPLGGADHFCGEVCLLAHLEGEGKTLHRPRRIA